MRYFILGTLFVAICALIVSPELRILAVHTARVCNEVLHTGFKTLFNLK